MIRDFTFEGCMEEVALFIQESSNKGDVVKKPVLMRQSPNKVCILREA